MGKKDNRITAVHKENGGVSSARNTAIDEANGEYIIFIDADDSASDKLAEEIVCAVESGLPDCVIYEHYIVTKTRKWVCTHSEKINEWESGNADFYKRFFGLDEPLIGTSVWNKAFRLDVIKQNNLKFKPQKNR